MAEESNVIFQRNPWLKPVLAVVLAIAAACALAFAFWPQKTLPVPTGVYYWDPARKDTVEGNLATAPAGVTEVIRAHVYANGACRDKAKRFVGYLEKGGRTIPGTEHRGDDRPGSAAVDESKAIAAKMVADADKPDQWAAADSPEGVAILQLTGKASAGVTPTECFPGM